jgi:hypothetical protein
MSSQSTKNYRVIKAKHEAKTTLKREHQIICVPRGKTPKLIYTAKDKRTV